MRKVEKAMAVDRPSKVGASWALNGWGSISTDLQPALRRGQGEGRPGHAGPGDDDVVAVSLGHGARLEG